MKRLATISLALLVGLAVGGGAISVLKAEGAKKPAFVIAEVDVLDADAFKAYAAKVPNTLKPYDARIIIRGKPDSREGEPPKGIIVAIEFGSLEDAQKWYSNPPYSQLIPDRQKSANTRLYIVEGLPQQ